MPASVRRVHDLRSVLVCFGDLLIYGGPVGGAYQDPLVLQLSPDVAALRRLPRCPAAHLASRPVGAGAEGLAHGPFGAGQNVRVAAHVPGRQDRLPYRAVAFGQFLVAGAEGAGGALAVHQDLAAVVLLELGVVAREVAEHPQWAIPWVEPRRGESLPRGVGDELSVGEGEVGRRIHGPKISFSFGTPYGRGGKLPVLEIYAVSGGVDLLARQLRCHQRQAAVHYERGAGCVR